VCSHQSILECVLIVCSHQSTFECAFIACSHSSILDLIWASTLDLRHSMGEQHSRCNVLMRAHYISHCRMCFHCVLSLEHITSTLLDGRAQQMQCAHQSTLHLTLLTLECAFIVCSH